MQRFPSRIDEVDAVVARAIAALPDLGAARAIAGELERLGGDRAVFARCILTLELAIAGDPQSREELSQHVAVLIQAYEDPMLAILLVAGNPLLVARWEKVRPVVQDFVRQRSAAEPGARQQPKSDASGPPVLYPKQAPKEGMAPPQLSRQTPAPPAPPTLPLSAPSTQPAATQPPKPAPRLATPLELIADIQALAAQPPAPAGARPPPAPPLPRVPTLPYRPPKPTDRLATPTELILEIQEIVEVAEPPPPPADSQEEQPVSEECLAFWQFTEEALGRAPDPSGSTVGQSSFPVQKSSDRARLVRFAHSLLERFSQVPQARSLAALVLLFVAGHEKERGLLGVNRERVEMLRTGLSLMGELKPASQVAAMFEHDGTHTRESFIVVLEAVRKYLGYCLANKLDPRDPETARNYPAI